MERLRRGWTLKQVSDLTRISITVLRLLEEKNFGKIGERHTVEMLLRTYSNGFEAQAPSPDPSMEGLRKDEAKRSWSRKLLSSSYFPPVLTVGLIVAIIAVLGLLHEKYGTWFASSDKPAVESRIENSAEGPKTVENSVAPVDTEKNSSRREQQVSTAAGIENRTDEHKAVKDNIEIRGEEEKTASPVEESQSVSQAQENRQEAFAREDEARDLNPGINSTSDGIAISPGGRSGSDSVPDSAEKNVTVGAPHRLEMETAQKTWIQVTIDGIRPQSELLQPGERRKWKALNKADLVIGNRGGVQLRWDGKPIELGNGKGRVIRLSLTDSGVVLK